jgi:anti-anti-sigma factor
VGGVTPPDNLAEPFEVRVQFTGTRVVLIVRGELDMATAPALGAVVDAIIDRGNVVVDVDLAGCQFIDGSGLQVIVAAACRADLWGGTLTVRAPSGPVRRLLALTGLGLTLQPLTRPPARPGVRSARVPAGTTTFPGHPSLLSMLAAGPDELLLATLRLLVALAGAAVGGADGVSVSLRRHDVLATVAASDQTVSDMDAEQYATGEGPCVDASIDGHPFYTASLPDEARWPLFTPRARALGINAILSSPLLVRDRPVGALNIYSRRPRAFAPGDRRLASVFATEASAILTAAAEDQTTPQTNDRLGEVLRTRQVITLAQGVLMERSHLDADHAYTTLRRFSSRTGQPLRERAEGIVASTRLPRSPPAPTSMLDPPEAPRG